MEGAAFRTVGPVKTRRDPVELSVVERAHPINGFIVDFYCARLRLVLELDGGIHEGIAKSEYDRARTTWLEARGFRVVRVKSRDFSEDQLKQLLQHVLSLRSPSPHRGEGDRG